MNIPQIHIVVQRNQLNEIRILINPLNMHPYWEVFVQFIIINNEDIGNQIKDNLDLTKESKYLNLEHFLFRLKILEAVIAALDFNVELEDFTVDQFFFDSPPQEEINSALRKFGSKLLIVHDEIIAMSPIVDGEQVKLFKISNGNFLLRFKDEDHIFNDIKSAMIKFCSLILLLV